MDDPGACAEPIACRQIGSGIIRIVATSRIGWVLSQVGRKPGSVEARGRLLAPADLPGPDWKILDERTWRTGSDATAEWQLRAKASGSVTAWRSFEQGGHDRWVWIQTTPAANGDDALAALSDIPARMLANMRATAKLLDERQVQPPAPLTAATGWAVEQRTQGAKGESTSLILASVCGRTVIVVAASGPSEAWTWDQVGDIAQQVSTRVSDS